MARGALPNSEGKAKKKRIYKPLTVAGKFCDCGKPAVKIIRGREYWCQGCIDKQAVVHDLHNREEYNLNKWKLQNERDSDELR